MEKINIGKKNIFVAIISVIALISMVGAYVTFSHKPTKGYKYVTLTVVDNNKNEVEYSCKTDGDFLLDVMKELEHDGLTFEGTESSYGLMIHTVNGLRADYNEDGAYWYFYVDGNACMNGVSTEPVNDGNNFEVVYTLAN